MPDFPANQPQPTGSQPNPWPPSYSQPPVAPYKKPGMSATKIVLIVVGVFLALGIIAVCVLGAGVYFIAKSAHKDANGQVSMDTPFGSVHTIAPDQVKESDFGIPFYPGARCVSGTRTETSSFTQLSATFLSEDTTDKVIAFYKEKAGTGAQPITLPFGGTQFNVSGQAGATISVLIMQTKSTTAGKTHIQITQTNQIAGAK